MDLNHGRLSSTDLQSVAIDHSAIPPSNLHSLEPARGLEPPTC